MPASYPTSAKSFSAKLNGDVIAVGHVTDLEAEVTAVETALVAGLPVTHGGTGVTTRTAYGVIVGGTTATGATQTVTPGTSGYLLTSGGASAVPTWAAAATVVTPTNVCNGRLTLTSVTPFTTSVSAATTLFFTPYEGNQIALYDGSSTWNVRTLTEISITLVGLTASKPYDVWVYDNAGTPTLELLVWTNDTTRATALTTQDGVYVKTGATTRRYVGTIYIDSGGGAVSDTYLLRHVYNAYNRESRAMRRLSATGSWTYSINTKRQANADTANQLSFMDGLGETAVSARLIAVAQNTSQAVINVGIGLDSTSVFATGDLSSEVSTPAAGQTFVIAQWTGFPGVGRHTLVWLEAAQAVGTTTWYGAGGGQYAQSGISAEVMG